jgi:anti-sigma regulatory factor (Ser/Thr protein kinase)
MEPIRDAVSIPITEETQIAAARRASAEFCRRLGLSDAVVARAELASVELAGNILHHAQRGTMFLGPTADGAGLQMIAADSGPGLGDLERAMRDGFSTHATPGLGLGAVRRKADHLDVYSRPGAGVVLAAIFRDTAAPPDHTAVLSTPIRGETVNGDSWAIYSSSGASPERAVYLLVDGLGHGYYAAQAASTARTVADRAFADDPAMPLSALVQRMHAPMQSTRGAAVLLVSVAGDKAVCCGIGNISAVLCAADGSTRNLVSHNGTVGHRMARVQEFDSLFAPGTLLVMHSDGVSTRWRLAQYPGLKDCSPATIAGVLYRDAVRERDDATVLVARLNARPGGDRQESETAHG